MNLPEAFDDLPIQPVYHPAFVKRFAKLRDNQSRKRLLRLVKRICEEPTSPASHLVSHSHGRDRRGKRDRHVKGDLIILYAWCHECLTLAFHTQGFNDCCLDPTLANPFEV